MSTSDGGERVINELGCLLQDYDNASTPAEVNEAIEKAKQAIIQELERAKKEARIEENKYHISDIQKDVGRDSVTDLFLLKVIEILKERIAELEAAINQEKEGQV